jgi:hypothetical protein
MLQCGGESMRKILNPLVEKKQTGYKEPEFRIGPLDYHVITAV